MRPPVVLTIAGFDGSGGAGIQADLKTFAALGCYGLSAMTAIALQNSCGVKKVIPCETLEEQLDTLFEDFPIDAIKIGMLADEKNIEIVEKFLVRCGKPSVFDPVQRSKNGTLLMPRIPSLACTLITPNLDEAEILLKNNPHDFSVLVKGGHRDGETCDDCLYHEGQIHRFSSPRIATKNSHGTGCTLSSAIAAQLARGETLVTAVAKAKKYLTAALEGASKWQLGKGFGPLHHFSEYW